VVVSARCSFIDLWGTSIKWARVSQYAGTKIDQSILQWGRSIHFLKFTADICATALFEAQRYHPINSVYGSTAGLLML
jgi:hypothetical protein